MSDYTKMRNNYINNLLQTKGKVTRKAMKYFDKAYNEDTSNFDITNLMELARQKAQNLTNDTISRWKAEWEGVLSDNLIKNREQDGYLFDANSGNWNPPKTVKKQPKVNKKQPKVNKEQTLKVEPKVDLKVEPKNEVISDIPGGTVTTDYSSYNFTDGLGYIPMQEQLGFFDSLEAPLVQLQVTNEPNSQIDQQNKIVKKLKNAPKLNTVEKFYLAPFDFLENILSYINKEKNHGINMGKLDPLLMGYKNGGNINKFQNGGNMDNELIGYLRTIYGNVLLDPRTLQQLQYVWKTNPNLIINLANLKLQQNMANTAQFKPRAVVLPATRDNGFKKSYLQPSKLDFKHPNTYADLSNAKTFGLAFNAASNAGLKTFNWRNGNYGTLKSANWKEHWFGNPSKEGIAWAEQEIENRMGSQNKPVNKDVTPKEKAVNDTMPKKIKADSRIPIPKNTMDNPINFIDFPRPYTPKPSPVNVNLMYNHIPRIYPTRFLQGGLIDMKKAFIAYLTQEAEKEGMSPEEYIKQLGEEGIVAKLQEFMLKMQGGVYAKLGAKLNYYRKLKGECPEGEELVYFQKGGRVCKVCQGKKLLKGNKIKKDPVKEWKEMRNNKKLDQASKDSIAANKFNDLEVLTSKPGNYKNGVWVPDRKKPPYKKIKK